LEIDARGWDGRRIWNWSGWCSSTYMDVTIGVDSDGGNVPFPEDQIGDTAELWLLYIELLGVDNGGSELLGTGVEELIVEDETGGGT
jgi:hypothetical protein